ncbi:hypothetical protein FQA39_LY00620 [Lamprigera yunnana]|nr:hypothetical protein FQA39_LY00620 [Lamprigera yunnana]
MVGCESVPNAIPLSEPLFRLQDVDVENEVLQILDENPKTIVGQKEAATLQKSAREAKRKLVIEESEERIEDVSVEDDEEDDPACLYCNGLYRLSRAHEDWIRCQKCNRWCHSECAGVSRRVKQFICDVCK